MNNKNERILIISDIHLTTNFIGKKFNYLKDLFRSVDKVIINGDFWTAYYNTFDEFLNTKWKELFPILRDKKAVYIYGNHDKEVWQDDRNSKFSIWAGSEFRFESHGVKYLITHGHNYLGDSISSEKFMKSWRFFKFDVIKYFIESLLLRLFGRYLYLIAKNLNNKVKEISKKMSDVDFLVIGHTHWAEIDKTNRFINSGLIHSGVSTYIIIENGKPELFYERY